MITRPTAVQATAIRTAIGNNRLLDLGDYATQTVAIMRRNGWIDLEPNGSTGRITPEAARSIGMFTIAERYEREDALADNPDAILQEKVIESLRNLGIDASVPVGRTGQVLVDVNGLAAILARIDSGVMV
jgi:hypothetical protein